MSSFNFGAKPGAGGGGFSFGTPNTTTTQTGAFSFGAAPFTSTPGGFSFGATTTSSTGTTGGFGTPASTGAATGTAGGFGTATTTSAPGGFGTTSITQQQTSASTGGFAFAEKPTTMSGGFSFGTPSTQSSAAKTQTDLTFGTPTTTQQTIGGFAFPINPLSTTSSVQQPLVTFAMPIPATQPQSTSTSKPSMSRGLLADNTTTQATSTGLQLNKKKMATAKNPVLPQKSDLDSVIECPLCLYTMQSPHMLQECFHSFCQTCIEEIPKQKVEDCHGWECPVCFKFTAENNLKPNDFISKLIQLKKQKQTGEDTTLCKQCPNKILAMWKCDDCKIELCDVCKISHLMIPVLKGHKVITLDTETKKVIDELVFCAQHDKKPLELNCPNCSIPICFDCKIDDHNIHPVERVNTALDRLILHLDNDTKIIKQQFKAIEKQITIVRQKIEETKQSYVSCKSEMDTRLEEMVTKLREANEEMKTELDVKGKEAILALEKVKMGLEGRLSEGKNLVLLKSVTIEYNRNMSLLQSLQGGLLDKMQNYIQDIHQIELEIPVPNQEYNSPDPDNFEEQRQFLGEVWQEMTICEISINGEIPFCFTDIFENDLTKELSIKLGSYCNRMSYIDGKIWTPHPLISQIAIYNTSGELEDTVHCNEKPLIVRQAHNGDLIMAGSRGVYIKRNLTSEGIKIANGDVADVAVQGNKFFVLDAKSNKVTTFENRIDSIPLHSTRQTLWTSTGSFSLCSTRHNRSTMLVTKDLIIISSPDDRFVCKYTYTGQVQSELESSSFRNQLCCFDEENSVLIAKYPTSYLILINNSNQVIKQCNLNGLAHLPRDVMIDREHNIWVLHGDALDVMKLTKVISVT